MILNSEKVYLKEKKEVGNSYFKIHLLFLFNKREVPIVILSQPTPQNQAATAKAY